MVESVVQSDRPETRMYLLPAIHPGNVARGTYGDAHIGFLVTGFGRNIDAAVYQLQHVRIGDHVFRTVHRSGGGDLIVRFPDG